VKVFTLLQGGQTSYPREGVGGVEREGSEMKNRTTLSCGVSIHSSRPKEIARLPRRVLQEGREPEPE